jgi:hypothetical protein
MRQPTIRLTVAVFTFLLGVCLSNIFIVFRLVAMGHGPGPRAVYGYQSVFDRWQVGTDGKKYDSPSMAVEELNKYAANAIKIVNRGSLFDQSGRKTGERLVAIVRFPHSNEPMAAVIWTEGPLLNFIVSHSLTHALRFESAQNSPEWLRKWLIY